jgi:hypothetical protein
MSSHSTTLAQDSATGFLSSDAKAISQIDELRADVSALFVSG